MNKVIFASLLAMGMTGASGVTANSAPASSPKVAPKPNIVFFIADDHSLLDSSVYGATDVRTPNMKRLSAAGMTFDRAFVASPSCAPSRAAFLSGLMPARNGAEPNHSRPRPGVKLLPAYLHAQGYEVVAFGKVAHYGQAKDFGFDLVEHDGFHDDECINAALKYLKARTSKKPLAFFVGTNWPHVPWPKKNEGYNPAALKLPPELLDTPQTRQTRARYYAAVSRFDTELGQVYDAARTRLGPNTFFLQSSDHGAQWPFAKWNCYDAGIRVPLIASWPGVIKAGTRTSAMVSWIDILPTLIEIAGGKPPVDIDGRSFLPVLRGKTTQHRDRIFTTHSADGDMNIYPIRSVRTSRWKFILNLHPEFAYTTHIDRNAKSEPDNYWNSWEAAAPTNARAATIIKRYHERPAEELYDLDSDPYEQNNLAAQPAYVQTKNNLRRELEAWMNAEGDKRTVFGKPHLLSEPDEIPTPQIVARELTLNCKVTPQSPNGVILAQGGNINGYALYLAEGKPIFVVRQKGQIYTAASTNSPTGTFSIEAHLQQDGTMTLATDGTIVARGKALGLFAAQPKEELSIGKDTFVAVGDYKAPYPLQGKVENVQIKTD
ncbi:choline-sulfatase [Abditibacteriota bacterium]|nr:choline-sulfatase [Abditibacteriota bacterium]